ncbi:MAG: hypothetical protein WA790_08865 [Sulfitobacter sp.]
MLIKKLLLIVCTALCVSTAKAQTVENYDPGYLPFKAKATNIAKCGVQVKLDRSWSSSTSQKKNANGIRIYNFKYTLSTAFWKRDGRPFNAFTVNPRPIFAVSCNRTSTKPDDKFGLEWIANNIRDSAAKNRKQKVGKLQSHTAPGLGKVYYFLIEEPGKVSLNDTLRLYGLSGDKLFDIFLTVPRTPGRKFRKNIKPGTTVSVPDFATGKVYQARFTTPGRLARDGAYIGVRSKKQNYAIFNTVIKSVRSR